MDLVKYLQSNRKKHLIFDLDETIVWLDYPWQLYKEKVWEILEQDYSNIIKNYPIESTRSFELVNILKNKYRNFDASKVYNWTVEFETNYLKGIKTNPELISFIQSNSNNYQFSLWTSQTRPAAIEALKQIELMDSFQSIVTRSDVEHMKPNPEGFALINKTNSPNNNFLMIGDSDYDEQAAQNAGIDFFLIDFFKK